MLRSIRKYKDTGGVVVDVNKLHYRGKISVRSHKINFFLL